MKKVVVFGAGLVVRAHVRYLLDHGFAVTLASRTVAKAEAILAGHPNGTPVAFDIEKEPGRLGELVAAHDLAVSLLPWQWHPAVAKACIAHGTHMVTTSYVKDEMQALDAEAKAKSVILLNELGVDPGIDHMTAMQIIDRVHGEGGEITTFRSYCGGLPAPEANDNPFGYKFSWSPRGVLLAGLNPARFRRGGELVEVPGERLLATVADVPIEIEGVRFELDGYPNRNSMPYTGWYGIDPRDEMFRGTLRFPFWCRTMLAIAKIGWLGTEPVTGFSGSTFAELTAHMAGVGRDNVERAVATTLGLPTDGPEIGAMRWLGLFGSEPLPAGRGPVDILTARMLATMSYAPDERDMLILQHTFIAEYPGGRRERIQSTMVDFGIPGGDSSMNRTVGLPAAVGARFILEGRFTRTGVQVPVMAEFYEPALEELQRLGISFTETVEAI